MSSSLISLLSSCSSLLCIFITMPTITHKPCCLARGGALVAPVSKGVFRGIMICSCWKGEKEGCPPLNSHVLNLSR